LFSWYCVDVYLYRAFLRSAYFESLIDSLLTPNKQMERNRWRTHFQLHIRSKTLPAVDQLSHIILSITFRLISECIKFLLLFIRESVNRCIISLFAQQELQEILIFWNNIVFSEWLIWWTRLSLWMAVHDI